MSKIKEAMEMLKVFKHGMTIHEEAFYIAGIDACIQAFEQNLPTREDIIEKLNYLCANELTIKNTIFCLDSFGLLRKPAKVKRWKWANEYVTTNKAMTEKEAILHIFGLDARWHKVEGSEVEEDV